LTGDFGTQSALLDGREMTVLDYTPETGELRIATTGLGFPESDFSVADPTSISILSGLSENVEAFFEGENLQPYGAVNSYNSQRIVLRETQAATHAYTNDELTVFDNFDDGGVVFTDANDVETTLLASLGLDTQTVSTSWVDELDPPIDIMYDAANQRFQFGINHTVLGPAGANFRAFKVFGAEGADATNNLGIPGADAADQVPISSTAKINARPFVADGPEMQINAKRYGVTVHYNSDVKSFTFSSGTTGESIRSDGALGVDQAQSASNIQVGRLAISEKDGSVTNDSFDTATRYLGVGDNALMGVGASKNDVIFEGPRGKAAQPAQAVGAPATEPLNEIFNLSTAGGANIFNVSVNGIGGVIEVPPGNYVGATLAEQLQTRINQIVDGETGQVVGGVSVSYRPDTNNFVFTTGTTGDSSTIKVKGAAKLGLADVPLGVGTVPELSILCRPPMHKVFPFT